MDDFVRGAEASRPRTVLLVDDHPVVALGVRLAFGKSRRFLLTGVASAPHEALSAAERLRPDAVIADLVYDSVVQVDLIRECRRILPHCALVVFSSLPHKIYEREAIKAGADRFVPKEQPLETVIAVLDELIDRPEIAAQGEPEINDSVVAQPFHGVYFTRREAEIGRLISTGLSAARIGVELGVSPNTIAVHRDNIRKKLNCRDSAELIARLARLYPVDSGND